MTRKPDESDATLQFRISDLDIPDAEKESPETGSAGPKNRREARLARKAHRVVLSLLLARAAALAPKYPRPGRTGWRRWMPSWRQWLGGVLTSIGVSALLHVAHLTTHICRYPENRKQEARDKTKQSDE